MEGLPVVLMEAMLSGVPVVSTRISGIPELVEDGSTGWLAEPRDPSDLARVIRSALASDDLPRMRSNAVRKVQAEYDLASNAKRLGGLF